QMSIFEPAVLTDPGCMTGQSQGWTSTQKHGKSALTVVVPLHMRMVPPGMDQFVVGISLRGTGSHPPNSLLHAEQQFIVLSIRQLVDARRLYGIDVVNLKIDMPQYR